MRIRVGRGHAKLLQRIQGNAHRTLQSAGGLVIVIDAVAGHVGLVAATAVYGSSTVVDIEAAGRRAITLVQVVARKSNTRLQGHESGGITSYKRQSLPLLGINCGP